MTIAIIVVPAAIIIGYLLYTSIIIRLKYKDTEKSVSLSYAIVAVKIDLTQLRGRLFLLHVPVYRFDLRKTKKKKKAKAEAKTKAKADKERPDKKPKRKKKFGLSDLKLEYLIMAKELMSGIRIRQLQINISGGYREPFYTGKMFAYYCAARGIYPKLMSHINFSPNFSSDKLKLEGKGLVSLRMFYIFKFVFGVLADKVKEKLNNLFVIRRKGASYG
jgi:hypothetical protein